MVFHSLFSFYCPLVLEESHTTDVQPCPYWSNSKQLSPGRMLLPHWKLFVITEIDINISSCDFIISHYSHWYSHYPSPSPHDDDKEDYHKDDDDDDAQISHNYTFSKIFMASTSRNRYLFNLLLSYLHLIFISSYLISGVSTRPRAGPSREHPHTTWCQTARSYGREIIKVGAAHTWQYMS